MSEKTVGSATYRFNPIPVRASMPIIDKLQAQAFSLKSSSVPKADASALAIAEALATWTDVEVEGKWLNLASIFDAHFGANTKQCLAFLRAAVEANFGDFFGEGSPEKGAPAAG